MKTERRHDLETNALAKNLRVWGEKLQPHVSTIMTVVAVVLAAYFLLSIWRNSGSRLDREAWDKYQMAVLGADLNMEQVQRVAATEAYAGSTMQEWAFMAWADRQLRVASERYLTDRDDANKRLTTIAAIYDQFATSATDEEVQNRARLGLARVSEMQNRLDDARKQYALVEGPFALLAEERIKALESKEAQETCEWLKTADLPKPRAASGPGTPGARPGLEATMPAADAEAGDAAGKSLQDILQGLSLDTEDGARYGEEAPSGATEAPAESGATPPAEPVPPSDAAPSGDAVPSEESTPSDEASPSGESGAEAPAADSSAAPEQPAAEETPAQQ